VPERGLSKLTLNHEHKAGRAGFDSFVAEQRETELVFLVYDSL
jgi:hypothetical protein